MAEQAHKALRAAIVAGDLRWGAKITERGLAESLGVSPTPVREALRRLEQEQLVERTGPRSLRVAAVSAQTRAESSVIEAALAGVAARFAALKVTTQQLARLERLLDAADAKAQLLHTNRDAGRELDTSAAADVFDSLRDFHNQVEEAAGNPQLMRTLEQVRAFSRSERLRIAVSQLADGGSAGQLHRYGQHRQILAALRARDADLAEQLARDHASSAGDDLTDWSV